ncbi:MAG: hypothetical protein HY243_13325 [Proteobacteria bacterium]|nr:hypothetical protein [Pseudomonadota bacterium]
MKLILRLAPLVALAALVPDSALAYVGPGAGLSALGTLAAFASALVLAVVGFVWYPLKRLLGLFRKRETSETAEE